MYTVILIAQGCCNGVPLQVLVLPRHSCLAIFFHVDTDLLDAKNSTFSWAEVEIFTNVSDLTKWEFNSELRIT